MPRPEIGRRALLGAGILLLGACRIETDRGPAAPLASSPAVDTMRAGCPERLPVLRPARRPAGREITRILPAPDGILLAGPEGLFQRGNGRTVRLLPRGRDWALERGVLARLGDGRIDLFDHHPRSTPTPRATLAAARHETSIALADGDLGRHPERAP